jgi:2-keto-4-pentenoate hydratase/2-oxohepta-3-ene-1,7-dioic acid hydratase in catechol pathway
VDVTSNFISTTHDVIVVLNAKFRDSSGTVHIGELDEGIIHADGETYLVANVDILPPTEPTKILGVGPNYYSNIEHYGRDEPASPGDLLIFVKTPPNVVVGHGETATLRPPGEFHFEGELGVVIGKRCHGVTEADAMSYVEGYTCVNEITNKALPESQYDASNRVRSKSFDDSSPVGPVVASPDEVPDDATLRLRVNGEEQQNDKISNMIFSVPALIEEVSTYLTLEPGDIIATGSPEGVDRLYDGDNVEVEVEGIGTVEHDVAIPTT